MPPILSVPVVLVALAPGAAAQSAAPDPSPLFKAYRAYQKAPDRHRERLLAALPRSAAGRRAFAALAMAPEGDPGTRAQPSMWEIQDAVLDLGRKGEPRAIDWLLAMTQEGEGGVREGFGKDAMELFKDPRLVARFWPRFQPHRASLRHLRTWTYPEHFPAIRAGYAEAFADRPALRDELLALIDSAE